MLTQYPHPSQQIWRIWFGGTQLLKHSIIRLKCQDCLVVTCAYIIHTSIHTVYMWMHSCLTFSYDISVWMIFSTFSVGTTVWRVVVLVVSEVGECSCNYNKYISVYVTIDLAACRGRLRVTYTSRSAILWCRHCFSTTIMSSNLFTYM